MKASPTRLLPALLFPLVALATARAAAPADSLDPSYLDRSADPCQDFYQFACGGWMKANPIPPDQSRWGQFSVLEEKNRSLLRGVLEGAAKGKAERSPEEQRIGDYYAACMDEKGIEALGVTPLKPELDRIAALSDKAGLPALVGHLHHEGVSVLFGFGSGADFKDSLHEIAQADQGGLSLPDRDYYLKDDPKSVELRKAWVGHVTRMMGLLGDPPETAAKEADTVLKVETALAKGSLDRTKRRDPANVYHKVSRKEWQGYLANLSLDGYLQEVGAPSFKELNVAVPGFFQALDAELKELPLADWKTYFRWHLVHSQADFLPKAFVEESFAFYGKTLTGAKEIKPRWKRCVAAVDGDLGEALGKVYVAKAFPPQAKERTLAMVKAIEAAMHKDLEGLSWMTEATRKRAFTKLSAVTNKIGYPDTWRDYSSVVVKRDDALGNSLRANEFEEHRQLKKIGGPVDRKEWGMTPPTVNAYYDPTENNINFPAGILQPPFFDFQADDALNFGGIGGVVGHELTHGFDDEGRKFDGDGNLKDWWTEADGKAFEERGKCVEDEYGSFTAVDDLKLNGKLTEGENVADNGGLRLAAMALAATDKTPASDPLGGFTPQQRLFLGWGRVWCTNQTEETARMRVTVDPHSPARFRVNGVVSNMQEFAAAFGCKAGQPMVREKPCRVW